MRHKAFLATGALAALAALLTLTFCSSESGPQQWEPPHAVKIEGAETCFNYSRSYLSWGSKPRKDRPAGLLVRDGDLLGIEKGGTFPTRPGDGVALSFKAEEGSLALANQIVSLAGLGKKPEDWQWLEKADQDALAKLRFVELSEGFDPARLPLLQKLAAANPTVGLSLDDLAAAQRVLPLFRPRQLFGGKFLFEKESAALLPNLKDLEILGIEAKQERKSLAFLDSLPSLRTLLLIDWDPLAAGPLPPGCERLRSLTLTGAKIDDLVPLAHLTGLEELYLTRCEELSDISGLASLPGLKALSLAGGKKVTDIAVLKKLTGLKVLGLPPGISQEQFAGVVRDHPGLQILEIVKCEKIADFAPLQSLKELQGLVLVGVPAVPAPLHELKQLAFLALDKEAFEKAPDDVAKLEKSLPRCLIVEGEGICLGSGWILFLAPAMAAAWAVRQRVRGCGKAYLAQRERRGSRGVNRQSAIGNRK